MQKHCIRFGLFPVRSPLLRESLRFLLLWLLRCFTSPGLLHTPMYSVYSTASRQWVTPLGHSRIKGCLGPPRDFSHPATSFFVIWCLGIHRAPLLKLRTTKTLNCAFVLYILYTYITLVNCQSTFRYFQHSHSISSELFLKPSLQTELILKRKEPHERFLKETRFSV